MTPPPGNRLNRGYRAHPLALRARGCARHPRSGFPPGDQSTSTPTTTDEKWGQIRPSRWGQRKSSFSERGCGRDWLASAILAATAGASVRRTHRGVSVSSRRTPISRPCSWRRSIRYPLISSSLRTTAGKSIPTARSSPSVSGCAPVLRSRSSIRTCWRSTSPIPRLSADSPLAVAKTVANTYKTRASLYRHGPPRAAPTLTTAVRYVNPGVALRAAAGGARIDVVGGAVGAVRCRRS